MAPKFETSDERYTWLNAVQAVGKGQHGQLRGRRGPLSEATPALLA